MTLNFQVSAKAPDGRIYVVGGENYSEFAGNLQDIFGPQADRVIEDFQFLVDPQSAPAVAAAAPLRDNGPSLAQSSAGVPAPGAPTCEHGARKFVTGNSAKGPWSAWMCPTPKGTPGQCKPQWA